ncbi:MAG: hypothetical protein ACPL7K_04865, partial [Armatimonadota bacterium]
AESVPNQSFSHVGRVVRTVDNASVTLDLTAVQDDLFGTFDMSGKQLVAMLVKNTGSSSATISPGSTDPYDFSNGAVHTVRGGGAFLLYAPSGMPTVSSTAKNISVNASSTKVYVIMVFGAE